MPYFMQALLKTENASKPFKRTESTRVAKSCEAVSRSEGKRSHGMKNQKSRVVWSQELHNQFLRALTDIGLRHAVPKVIHQVISARSLSPLFHCSVRKQVPRLMYTLCQVLPGSLHSCVH
jgi:SHAQKYF class myb-like DNA-binding protein